MKASVPVEAPAGGTRPHSAMGARAPPAFDEAMNAPGTRRISATPQLAQVHELKDIPTLYPQLSPSRTNSLLRTRSLRQVRHGTAPARSTGAAPERSAKVTKRASMPPGKLDASAPPTHPNLIPGIPLVSRVCPATLRDERFANPPADETMMDALVTTLAQRCWDTQVSLEDDPVLPPREELATWLGKPGDLPQRVREHYFRHFTFAGQTLDGALRSLCERLVLRAETQQLDRVLDAFGARYIACNPQSALRTADVVHSVAFSLLLLNTDLHVADTHEHMKRTQFVRNTLAALAELYPEYTWLGSEHGAPLWRSASRLRWAAAPDSSNSDDASGAASLELTASAAVCSRGAAVVRRATSPHTSPRTSLELVMAGGGAADKWPTVVAGILRELYTAVQERPLTLHRALCTPAAGTAPGERTNTARDGALSRSGSMRRSVRTPDSGTSPSVPPRESSLDGRTAIVCPSSASDSAAAELAAVISEREQALPEGATDAGAANGSEAHGASPELPSMLGILAHRSLADTKRLRLRTWSTYLVVLQSGSLALHAVPHQQAAQMQALLSRGEHGYVSRLPLVHQLDLAHSVADVLPTRTLTSRRPHSWSLVLSDGSVHLFQAQDDVTAQRWATQCTYSAARVSKEPLSGGVSNIDYGWRHVSGQWTPQLPRRSQSQASFLTRVLQRVPGRKQGQSVALGEWVPPLGTPPHSKLRESEQARHCAQYASYLGEQLQEHEAVRRPMQALWKDSPAALGKANSNWERKYRFLEQEHTKYARYCEALGATV